MTPQKVIKEFDEKFSPETRKGDVTYDISEEIRCFIRDTILSVLQEQKAVVEGKRKKKNSIKHFAGNGYFNQQGYNQAVDDFAHLLEETIWVQDICTNAFTGYNRSMKDPRNFI
jgi:hypothetical protein